MKLIIGNLTINIIRYDFLANNDLESDDLENLYFIIDKEYDIENNYNNLIIIMLDNGELIQYKGFKYGQTFINEDNETTISFYKERNRQ